MKRWCFLPCLAALLLLAPSMGRSRESASIFDTCRERFDKEGKKLNMAAATYFGAAGAEEFTAVGIRKDGTILAMGNSWGPPFPEGIPIEVIGADAPWDVPLRIPGMDKGDNYALGFKGLKWIGYQDYVSLECGGPKDQDERKKALVAAVKLLREQWAQA